MEQVVAAAIAVLDDEGVAGLSMRKVAERLGSGAATLYAYVSGRDELLELVFDELVGRVSVPEPDPERWSDQLIKTMQDLHAVLIAHRDASLAGLGFIPTTPKAMAAAEALSQIMRAGGLTDRVIGLGLDAMFLYVAAAAFEDSLMYENLVPEDFAAYHEQIHEFFAAMPSDRFPTLVSLIPHLTGPDGDERFLFGLQALIAGFEALSRQERG